jgi:hypothetical protein
MHVVVRYNWKFAHVNIAVAVAGIAVDSSAQVPDCTMSFVVRLAALDNVEDMKVAHSMMVVDKRLQEEADRHRLTVEDKH